MNVRWRRLALSLLSTTLSACVVPLGGGAMTIIPIPHLAGGNSDEPEANRDTPRTFRFCGFSIDYPRNWRLVNETDPSVPKCQVAVHTAKGRGLVRFFVDGEVVDPLTALVASLPDEGRKAVPPNPAALAARYGSFRGAGITYSKGRIQVRKFVFVAAGRTYTVAEAASESDRVNADSGFAFIENSFEIAGYEPPRINVRPREWVAEARRLYFAGRFAEAVSVLVQVQSACENGCEVVDHTATWTLMGTIQARTNHIAATKTYVDMLKADPLAILDPTLATREAIAAFAEARAQVPLPPPPPTSAQPAMPATTPPETLPEDVKE
jgi:hypothetical protein